MLVQDLSPLGRGLATRKGAGSRGASVRFSARIVTLEDLADVLLVRCQCSLVLSLHLSRALVHPSRFEGLVRLVPPARPQEFPPRVQFLGLLGLLYGEQGLHVHSLAHELIHQSRALVLLVRLGQDPSKWVSQLVGLVVFLTLVVQAVLLQRLDPLSLSLLLLDRVGCEDSCLRCFFLPTKLLSELCRVRTLPGRCRLLGLLLGFLGRLDFGLCLFASTSSADELSVQLFGCLGSLRVLPANVLLSLASSLLPSLFCLFL